MEATPLDLPTEFDPDSRYRASAIRDWATYYMLHFVDLEHVVHTSGGNHERIIRTPREDWAPRETLIIARVKGATVQRKNVTSLTVQTFDSLPGFTKAIKKGDENEAKLSFPEADYDKNVLYLRPNRGLLFDNALYPEKAKIAKYPRTERIEQFYPDTEVDLARSTKLLGVVLELLNVAADDFPYYPRQAG